jgi:pseudouridine-5'-phosphate glycosidase
MAVGLAKGSVGATTVSGTMVAAHRAGIPVFVTGGLSSSLLKSSVVTHTNVCVCVLLLLTGLGGVHRGAQSSMDISADLTELGMSLLAVLLVHILYNARFSYVSGRTPVAVVCAG